MEEQVTTLGVFGYVKTDPGLIRVLGGGRYKLLWLFPPGKARKAMLKIRDQPPAVLVVNPCYVRQLDGGFRSVLPPYVKVVQMRYPFGMDEIREPLYLTRAA